MIKDALNHAPRGMHPWLRATCCEVNARDSNSDPRALRLVFHAEPGRLFIARIIQRFLKGFPRKFRPMNMAVRWLAGALMAAACLSPALADDARAQLQRFVAEVQSATGRFTQQVVDDQGQQRQAQQGEFAFQRPGRFLWHTLQPYEQLVVSDGQVLRQYDPDLAQVTERPVDQSVGASPAAILFGSGSLEEAFELTAQSDRDGLAWLRARPRSGDAGFAHVDIGFSEGLPRRLELLDAFGQTTRIGLSDMVSNPELPPGTFTFDVPADVDVVRMQ